MAFDELFKGFRNIAGGVKEGLTGVLDTFSTAASDLHSNITNTREVPDTAEQLTYKDRSRKVRGYLDSGRFDLIGASSVQEFERVIQNNPMYEKRVKDYQLKLRGLNTPIISRMKGKGKLGK